jgi:dolichol-phosphate mannosyltransferase
MNNKDVLSVVIPAYNEAGNLRTIVDSIKQHAAHLFDALEIIIVNDGSTDKTQEVLASIARVDASVKPITFSRNFGKEAAIEAGLELSCGDAVLLIDADSQHPPSLIPAMVEKWKAGAHVVNAKKRDRGNESKAYGLASKLFYRLFSAAAGVEFKGASDFKLLDREVVDALNACREHARFFRGLVAWVGFDQVDMMFDVQPRSVGHSSWSTLSLIKYSIRNLITFSSLPLTAIAVCGFGLTVLSFLLIVQTLVRYMTGESLSGFTTIIIAQAAFSGAILFAVGVIALYVGRVYEEQKGRPTYIVRRATKETQSACRVKE